MTSLIQLHHTFSGHIITPSDPEYQQAKTVYATSGSPLAILIPQSNQDIAVAIDFAKQQDIPFSVRGGGHSGMGHSTNNGGIVLDMQHYKAVSIQDKEAHIVRVGGGALWGEVANQIADDNLVISAGDTASVGVGGLTVGGGIGIMVRKYGLAIDQLVGAEIVTANGKTLTINDHENSDLFWAIRGGGGNFGVVTHFDFAAHVLQEVYFGSLTYKLEDTKDLLVNWRDVTRESSHEVTTTLVVMPGFNGNPPFAQVYFCYAGGEIEGKKALQPFLDIAPTTDVSVELMHYKNALQEAHPPAGVVPVIKDVLIDSLDDHIIDIITTEYTDTANRMLFLRSLGGEINKHPQDETSYAHRSQEVMLLCAVFLPEETAHETSNEALAFFDQKIAPLATGAYPNFFSTYSRADFERMYPAKTLARLQKIKRTYDPDNIFSQNYNILP